jgi:hypothetical protein
MEEDHGIPLFKTTGTSNKLDYLAALCVLAWIFAMILFFVSLGTQKIIGPWYMWGVIIFGLIIFGFILTRLSKITVQLFRKNNGEMILIVNEPWNKIVLPFRTEEVRSWCFLRPVSYTYYPRIDVVYYCKMVGTDEKLISFQKIMNLKESEKPEWEYRDVLIPKDGYLYNIDNITGLVECIKKNGD